MVLSLRKQLIYEAFPSAKLAIKLCSVRRRHGLERSNRTYTSDQRRRFRADRLIRGDDRKIK